MKTLRIHDYDMAYLDLGAGPPTVLVHGSLNDFRTWAAVLGPLTAGRRVVAPSLRHYFPELWDGMDGRFSIDQHVDDMITFIEALDVGPVDLIGHSRGGHISFRLASKRPDLLRKLVLAEPGGTLEECLVPDDAPVAGSLEYVAASSAKVLAGDLESGLKVFVDGVNGPGTWEKLPLELRQMREDNAYTLIAQINEGRQPYHRSEAEALSVPTLFVIGGDTPGMLPIISEVLSAHVPNAKKVVIPGAGHSMFRQQPKAFCNAVLSFLASYA